MVLFLFVVMLLNVGPDERRIGWVHLDRWWFGLLALLFLALFLVLAGQAVSAPTAGPAPATTQPGGVADVATALFSRFLLPFELAALLLTVALVGTVFLAKRRI